MGQSLPLFSFLLSYCRNFKESYLGSRQLSQKIYSLLPTRESLCFLNSNSLRTFGSGRELGDHLDYSPMSPSQKTLEIGCFHGKAIAHFAKGKVLMSLMILVVSCQVVMIKGGKAN